MSFKQFLKEEPDEKAVGAEILRAFQCRGCDYQGPESQHDGGVYVGIRDWGRWEHDEGNEDDEDDDHEVLSAASSKELRTKIDALKAKYPKFKIQYGTGQKNWIDIIIKAAP